jgi:hypothetical protein
MNEMNTLNKLGSYKEEDVTFLLKDISDLNIELDNETRELKKFEGIHYSEMLPIEYTPKEEYMKLYYEFIEEFGEELALNIGVLSERILAKKGKSIVLVSLARAGTPVGVLLKRYFKDILNIDVHHYSISIIRDVGIDYNAMKHILKNHNGSDVVFVDGWTGKGAITMQLKASCEKLEKDYGIKVSSELAVVADPGHCAEIYGTRSDLLIPSSCLNSTVSGLMSRTVYNSDWIGKDDFHGAKYYKDLESVDVSNEFIEQISNYFIDVSKLNKDYIYNYDNELTWKGLKFVTEVQNEYGIDDINKIKPGVGETTRVLLRRVPWMILVRDMNDIKIKHILLLAEDRNVKIEVKSDMPYACCGIVKDMSEGN